MQQPTATKTARPSDRRYIAPTMSTITLEIFITKSTGIQDVMKVDFPSTATLGDVTLQIADKIGIPASQQQIKSNKKTINLREDTLESLKLTNLAKLYIKRKDIKWADHICARAECVSQIHQIRSDIFHGYH